MADLVATCTLSFTNKFHNIFICKLALLGHFYFLFNAQLRVHLQSPWELLQVIDSLSQVLRKV